ncbi:hypothetical protein Q7P35_004763 [Cladosporium inversicolor]
MNDPTPSDSPPQKNARRAQIAVAYAAEGRPNVMAFVQRAFPVRITTILAIRRKNEALQTQCEEHQDLLQNLVSVTEADALVLLTRLREGDSASSVTRFAENMQRHHRWRGLNSEALFPSPSPVSNSPMVMATQSDTPQTLTPVTLEPPAASRIVFEPRVDELIILGATLKRPNYAGQTMPINKHGLGIVVSRGCVVPEVLEKAKTAPYDTKPKEK